MLKFLTRLVTVLTATMIAGLLVIIALFVIRFWGNDAPDLPATITLPDGARATAFTQGTGWYAIVTADDRILIYDRTTGNLRQSVTIEPDD
ncbi:hypothetical protein SAMN04487859_105203 [Roseovarius lutimaris]|uniref:Uncharacterized protein n=2 Tax=Roseovarius lutimaris TaxID=1005928 RepID=A0A1I5AB32_9RHOB|nr:hypothetical protein SAMN04487859_105203 [Roseovarius lutimaris]